MGCPQIVGVPGHVKGAMREEDSSSQLLRKNVAAVYLEGKELKFHKCQ